MIEQKILTQRKIEPRNPRLPRLLLIQAALHRLVQRKIGQAQHRAFIAIRCIKPLLPVRQARRIRHPRLRHNCQIRILRHHPSAPLRHVLLVGIGIRIHPDAIDPRVLHPPERILYQIICQPLIPLIQIRHIHHKPTLHRSIPIQLRVVRIAHRRRSEIGRPHLLQIVNPVVPRRVHCQPMMRAHVIVNHIHNHLHPAIVRRLHQCAILLIRTKPPIHLVHIGRCISMIRPILRRHIVLERRRKPHRRHPQILNIPKPIRQPLQIPAMPPARLRPIHRLQHPLNRIIRRIPIRKPIRHQQVDHIRRIHTLVPQPIRITLF